MDISATDKEVDFQNNYTHYFTSRTWTDLVNLLTFSVKYLYPKSTAVCSAVRGFLDAGGSQASSIFLLVPYVKRSICNMCLILLTTCMFVVTCMSYSCNMYIKFRMPVTLINITSVFVYYCLDTEMLRH